MKEEKCRANIRNIDLINFVFPVSSSLSKAGFNSSQLCQPQNVWKNALETPAQNQTDTT